MIYSQLSTPTSNSLDKATALANALTHIEASLYKWEMDDDEQHLKWESGDAKATCFLQDNSYLFQLKSILVQRPIGWLINLISKHMHLFTRRSLCRRQYWRSAS
jgi:hypothetical protein